MRTIGDLLVEYKEKPQGSEDLPVLTLTERNGFIPQVDRFNKRLATEDTSSYKVVRRNDLAFNPYLLWAGAVAQNTIVDAGVISPLYPTFHVREGHDARYVARLLLTPQMIGAYDGIAFGSVPRRRRSSVSDFLALPLPTVPPLEEQRRIAAILDHADAIRAKRRQVLAHLDALPYAIFDKMFGDGLRNPNGYPVSPLQDLIEDGRPITYGILKPGPEVGDGVPYVRVADMKDGGIDLAGVRRTSPEISRGYSRSLLRSGDLLMSIRGHVGRFAHIPPDLNGANITQDSARLSVKHPALSRFVRQAMSTVGLQDWMRRHTKGVAVKGLNIGDLRQVPIPLPPFAALPSSGGGERRAGGLMAG